MDKLMELLVPGLKDALVRETLESNRETLVTCL